MLFKFLALLILLTCQDELKLESLKPGSVVRFGLSNQKSIIGEFLSADGTIVQCLDLETLESAEIPRNQIESIRDNVNQTLIFERAGVGRWLGWQLSKQFEDASKPQTIASIQQASVFVTANATSGVMVGDDAWVYRLGEPIKDPNTGEVLDTPEQKIGQMSVIDVSEKLITCRPSGEFTIELKVGDLVRPAVPRLNVAVLPFTDSDGKPTKSGLFFSNEVSNALTALGIACLERDKLASILEEQRLQFELREGDVARLGKLMGAATLVTGTLAAKPSDPKTIVLSLRLLDVKTGIVALAVNAELPVKDIDNSPAIQSTVLAAVPRHRENSYIGIDPFDKGSRSMALAVPKDASKVEVSFENYLEDNLTLWYPGLHGKLLVNGRPVIMWVEDDTRIVSKKPKTFAIYQLYDGTRLELEVTTSAIKDTAFKIDITTLVHRGEDNTVVYSKDSNYRHALRVWITK